MFPSPRVTAKSAFCSTLAVIAALLLLTFSVERPAEAANSSSLLIQQQNGAVANGTTLSLNLIGVPAAGHTIVLAVLYKNAANTGNINVSGLGATWISGYQASGSGMSLAFIYGQNTSGVGQTITITVPVADTLVATCSDWINLTTVEDVGSQATATANSASSSVSSTTSNPNAVVFSVTAYLGAPLTSPPQNDFVPLNTATAATTNLIGGYKVAGSTGAYPNNFVFNASTQWLSASVALDSPGVNQPLFSATPLIDYAANQLYLNKFPGFLYNGSNTMAPAHDADGRTIAAQMQPLDASGNISANGKIVAVEIGMQNWTLEMCTPNTPFMGCLPNTFNDDAAKLAGINPKLKLVDCAQGGTFTTDWSNLNSAAWTNCLSRMANPGYGVTSSQVQVVLWKQIDAYPKISLSSLSGSTCPANPVNGKDPDACVYESEMAAVVRAVKTQFPNAQQMFLHSRTYAGYATAHENSEPFAYEYGFSNKWLIQAQTNQLAGGGIDPLAGDLSYPVAPWLAWGPYFWASGTTPRSDGQTWFGGDFQSDGTHISNCTFYGITCGVKKIADLMIAFYSTSPYTTWFMSGPTPTPSISPTPTATPTPVATLSLSTAAINFGRLSIGDTSSVKTVNVTNVGAVAANFSSISVTGPNAADFQITSNNCGASLNASSSCTLKLDFIASAAAGTTETGTLTLTDNASNNPQTVALSGSPIAGLSTAPVSLSFGTVLTGHASASKTLTVKNSHSYSISLQQAFSGSAAADYALTSGTTCSSSLSANTQCTDSVTFTPSSSGTRSATLTISDGIDTPVAVGLTGSGG